MKSDSEKGRYKSPDGSAAWEYIGVVSCASLIFCGGCAGAWMAPTLGILTGPNSPINLTSSDTSTLTAMAPLGHAIAPAFTMVMADKLGRKNSLVVSGIPAIISWAMITVSANIVVLDVARFIIGFSFGLFGCIPPMYLGEIASVKLRGTIGMVCGTMLNAGVVFTFATVPYMSMKMTAYVCGAIAMVSTIGAWFIPESPYFLAMVGKFDEAEGALEKLRGKTDVGEELELVKMTVRQKSNARDNLELREKGQDQKAPKRPSAFKQLLTVPGNRKAFGIMLLFTTALQMGSYVTVMVYGDIIFTKMNTGIESQLCTIILGVIQLSSNILVAFIIDKVGRKPLICASGLLAGLCTLVVGVYFYLMEYTEVDVSSYGLFALCFVFLKMIALSFGLMPLLSVIQSEILDTEVKALSTCFIGITSGLMAAIGLKGYLAVAVDWGYGHSVPFLSYAANTWICTALILKLLPETKGKTLLDIQRDLNA